MFKISSLFIFLLTLTPFVSDLEAREPYRVTITVGPDTASVSDPNLVDLKRDLRTKAIEELIPIYSSTSAVGFDFNLRGILAGASFAINSTTLVVTIPQAGTSVAFAGATRDESMALFKEYLRDGGAHHRLLRAYAKYSPIDPIAGNPNSLMAKMAESDCRLGNLYPLSGCNCLSQPVSHLFQARVDFGRAFSKGFDTTAFHFPLCYSYSPRRTWAFIVDLPLTYNRNGGASSLFSSFGVGLRYPVNACWTLVPVARFGAGGTLDLCTSGSFLSTGLTSVYNMKKGNFVLGITNYASYISSTNLWLTGINFNYNLHEVVFKNGLSITTCKGIKLCGRLLNFQVMFEDTCFTRDKLYIMHYDEVFISLIANRINPCLNYDLIEFGVSYQFGEKDYEGYFINLRYQF